MKPEVVEGSLEERERLAGDAVESSPAPRSCFHSTRLFMVVFLGGWVMQGMFFTYFVGVITTLEKLFRMESKTTGTLLAATEIGQICTALLLTYAAGRGHRPRWIAAMMLVFALGVLGCVLPHVVFGARLLDVHVSALAELPRCDDVTSNWVNATKVTECARQHEHTDMRATVVPWLFACLLVVGVGQTGIATLGIPYIDDNVASRRSPLYMAITIGIRVIGPALGFLLGALCTSVYVDPLHPPTFDKTDPKWVGAWWLGMVAVSGTVVLLSLLMFCFPRQIRARPAPPPPPRLKPAPDDPPARSTRAILKDFGATLKRQLTNDILMWRTASSVLHLVPITGLYSFLPKYLETQFHLSSSDANLVSGTGGILVMGLGIVTSGAIILKLLPTARQVAAWTAATALIYSIGMLVLMFVTCSTPPRSALLPTYSGGVRVYNHTYGWPECAENCRCSSERLSAVCGQDGVTYLSACEAGCRVARGDGNRTYFLDCRCVNNTAVAPLSQLSPPPPSANKMVGGWAVAGECGSSCVQFYLFLLLFALVMFVHASGEVGSVLLIIRCTDPRDKAMAMGVIQFAIGVFGNVPCPVVFGAVVDAACAARDRVCGAAGACAHYDPDHFRHYFLGLTGGIMLVAFVMDLLVWKKASRIDMNPEESPPGDKSSPPPLTDTEL